MNRTRAQRGADCTTPTLDRERAARWSLAGLDPGRCLSWRAAPWCRDDALGLVPDPDLPTPLVLEGLRYYRERAARRFMEMTLEIAKMRLRGAPKLRIAFAVASAASFCALAIKPLPGFVCVGARR